MTAALLLDRLLSAKEAAEYLGVSLKRLYEFCGDGSLRHLRLADTNAGVLRFRQQWLDAWAEARAVGGVTPAPKVQPSPRMNHRLRYWLLSEHQEHPVQRALATAATLPEAIQLATRQTAERLAIFDTAN